MMFDVGVEVDLDGRTRPKVSVVDYMPEIGTTDIDRHEVSNLSLGATWTHEPAHIVKVYI
jgi:hypothetical protein